MHCIEKREGHFGLVQAARANAQERRDRVQSVCGARHLFDEQPGRVRKANRRESNAPGHRGACDQRRAGTSCRSATHAVDTRQVREWYESERSVGQIETSQSTRTAHRSYVRSTRDGRCFHRRFGRFSFSQHLFICRNTLLFSRLPMF